MAVALPTATFANLPQRAPLGPPRCAGWALNPKGPQVIPFRHQMGRHPTIWDFKTGIQHRIPARISPWGSRWGPGAAWGFLMQDTLGGSKWGGSGVLAGPGTPRDPKSHLFATKWVAIPPFWTLRPGSGSEFRPGSRRGGPGAQIPTFFSPILDQKLPKVNFLGKF